jgi:16S rRNA (adenine1518-N6/adenine1519-N6)-dimethyltransferase
VTAPLTRKESLILRLQELNSGPKRALGQNFLVSDMVIDRILFAVRSEGFSEIVELGPGLGALTEDLIKITIDKKMRLTLLELDRDFCQDWRERGNREKTSSGLEMRLFEGDALKMEWSDFQLNENALFVSNLPYQISSSLVIERSLSPAGIRRMILMFQKEVAQRISARAKTPEYGLLTVIAQAFWETSLVCEAGPRDFHPQPNVASRVLMFKWRNKTPLLEAIQAGQGASAQGFLKFAKAAFAHRRKLLSRNLLSDYFGGNGIALPAIEEVFDSQGLLKTARAEELDPVAFVRLYLAFVNAKAE